MKVMLVDDSATMRRIQKTQLSGMGLTDVVEAGNGEEAMARLQENMPVDLVLLDWNMPVMDGMTFLKKVRENDSYSKVKIIMCTSESEQPEALKEKLGISCRPVERGNGTTSRPRGRAGPESP